MKQSFKQVPLARRMARAIRAALIAGGLALFTVAPAVAQIHASLPLDPSQIPGKPGTVISSEPTGGAPEGAAAYRFLYRSTGLQGEPIAVSGLAVIPLNAPADRPIVAWDHPTSGLVIRCAPSLARKRYQFIPGLKAMIARGYVVVATDYPGLGTPGVHPYLVGDSEARATLDSVRAVHQLPNAEAGDRFVVWGHSQGGQAALFTALEAATYAPELKLLGVAAAAPATDLAALLTADLDTPAGQNLTAMTLWSWARIYSAPVGEVLDPTRLRPWRGSPRSASSRSTTSSFGASRAGRCVITSSPIQPSPRGHRGRLCWLPIRRVSSRRTSR